MTAVGALPAGADPALEAAFVTGDFDAADRVLADELAAARSAGDRGTEAETLHWQAMALHYRAIDAGLASLSPEAVAAEEALFTGRRRAVLLRGAHLGRAARRPAHVVRGASAPRLLPPSGHRPPRCRRRAPAALLGSAGRAGRSASARDGRRDEGIAALRASVEQAATGRLRLMWAGMAADWLHRAEAGETPSFARS
jgi:hypothetical protein